MNTTILSRLLSRNHQEDISSASTDFEHPDLMIFTDRARQLAEIAASGDEDNAECAAADLDREFPAHP